MLGGFFFQTNMSSLFVDSQFNTLALHLAAPSAWVSKLKAIKSN
jgi:hypothetical protein